MGRILRVDLSTEAIESEPLPLDLCHDYLGGYGFGARYLMDHQEAGVGPLSAGNTLGFITGPLTGTPAIGYLFNRAPLRRDLRPSVATSTSARALAQSRQAEADASARAAEQKEQKVVPAMIIKAEEPKE